MREETRGAEQAHTHHCGTKCTSSARCQAICLRPVWATLQVAPTSKMSLAESPSFTTTSRPIKSVSLSSDAYVLTLASAHSHYAASSSAPLNAIHLYDKSDLRPVGQLAGHGEAISTMRSVPNFSGTSRETLISCGKDGMIKVWDERAGTAAVQCMSSIIV